MSENRPPAPDSHGGAKRILLADDEKLLHVVLGDVLEGQGYQVLHAMDGREAVELARKEAPRLVLMDIMMPAMNGIEALEALKAGDDTRGIPVVAITADVLGRGRDEMLRQGFDGYIPKPFTAGQLLGEISRFVGDG